MSLHSVILIINAVFINKIVCFNLSPHPNLILKEPQLVTYLPQVRSSYFGYSLNLRPSGVIIGAPRAQSTLISQQAINETGAIYRCLFQNHATIGRTICTPYIFDEHFNSYADESEDEFESEQHDNQWLGATIAGGTKDTDKLLVCAPRYVTPNNDLDYLMHGLCYWINDTLSKEAPINVKKIIGKLLQKDDQRIKLTKDLFYYKYSYAEQGLSAHVTANNEEFLIGAPGINTWKGSVVHYHKVTLRENHGVSRRDTRSNGNREKNKKTTHYHTNIRNPKEWKQQNDSYFGYAVASGYFDSNERDKLMYIATAPQANQQSGEAYLFDFDSDLSINKEYTFRGLESYFGEYFGYAVLAEDLNGDNLTDVIVAAPLHSKTGCFDDGAIYIFINQGEFIFKRILLTSPTSNCNARFGTTLTHLGDINHDGFNDIAIGAPFADNGLVYIYLGSENGLRSTHSQLLEPPKTKLENQYGAYMFGHGLSKGCDIDNNDFNDLAIGAPNAEAVLLYRAYPVIKITATLSSETREIQPEQKTLNVTMCYSIATTSQKLKNQELALRIVLDAKVKRIVYLQKNELSFNVTAGVQRKCQNFNLTVQFNENKIFEAIILEVHYDIIHGVPETADFCETCAAVDPAEPKNYTHKISFNTGCASDTCVADLNVSSYKKSLFIFGSSDKYEITYDISNYGETAYLPQINLTSLNRMHFKLIPSYCKSENVYFLICDLNQRTPMKNGARATITIIYDVSGIAGETMTLTAQVFSAGNELTAHNNKITDVITLQEFTQIDVVGAPATKDIYLKQVADMAAVINNYEIKSNGPSIVSVMEIEFNIPTAYKVTGSSAIIPIIDLNNFTMQAVNDAQFIKTELYLNDTQLFKTSPLASDYSLTSRYNATTRTIFKNHYAKILEAPTNLHSNDKLKHELPVNRTIVFDCNDAALTVCVRAVMRVQNFNPGKSIMLTMKYHIDLSEVNLILIEPWEFFVVLIDLNVKKIGAAMVNNSESMDIRQHLKYNIISKHQPYDTPFWIIILAIVGGLIALALISYGMYKFGFFKRAEKDEMDRLMIANLQGVNQCRKSVISDFSTNKPTFPYGAED